MTPIAEALKPRHRDDYAVAYVVVQRPFTVFLITRSSCDHDNNEPAELPGPESRGATKFRTSHWPCRFDYYHNEGIEQVLFPTMNVAWTRSHNVLKAGASGKWSGSLADLLLVILLCIVFWVQLRPSNLRQSCLWNLLLLTVFSILDISLAYYLFDGRYDRPWSEWITLVLWLVSSQSLRHFFDSSHATRFD